MTLDDDPCGPPCGEFSAHSWRLTVHEGRVSLDSGCSECNTVVMEPVGGEDVMMEVEIVGTLTSHLERYGWETPEYDHWWEFTPTHIARRRPMSNCELCRSGAPPSRPCPECEGVGWMTYGSHSTDSEPCRTCGDRGRIEPPSDASSDD